MVEPNLLRTTSNIAGMYANHIVDTLFDTETHQPGESDDSCPQIVVKA